VLAIVKIETSSNCSGEKHVNAIGNSYRCMYVLPSVKRVSNDDRGEESGDEYQGGFIGHIPKISLEENLRRGTVCGET
jgi:hypothetical protein